MAGMRTEFTAASTAFVLPEQKRNMQRLHDNLQARGILPLEKVLTATNYQQGRFMRLPTHVLVVTMARLTYTHDSGIRSIPLNAIDLTSVRSKAGIANGSLELTLRTGETLTFTKGISLCIQEVASTLELLRAAGGESVGTPPDLVDEWGEGPQLSPLDGSYSDGDDVGYRAAAAPASSTNAFAAAGLPTPANGYQYTDEEARANAEAVIAALNPKRAPLPEPALGKVFELTTATVFAKPIPGTIFSALRAMRFTDDPDLGAIVVGLLDDDTPPAPDAVLDFDDMRAWACITPQPDDPNLFNFTVDLRGAPLPWPDAPASYIGDYTTWFELLVRVPTGADAASTLAAAVGDLIGPGTWILRETNDRSTWSCAGGVWTETL